MARIVSYIVESLLDHNNLSDLTVGDDHTQYALLAGRSTPQQVHFGTAASATTGYLSSTAHATKGKYFLNSAGTITVDDANLRFGIGTATPSSICVAQFDVASTGSLGDPVQEPVFRISNYDNVGAAYIQCLVGAAADVAGGIRLKHESSTSGDAYLSLHLGSSNEERLRIAKTGIISLPGTTAALLLHRLTTTQRDALTAVNGMLIYNSTTATFQGYQAGVWTNLI